MIYNSDITKRIIDTLGIESKSWSKPIIRNALEDRVNTLSDRILSANAEVDTKELKLTYREVKQLDDDFMELYIKELG